MRRLLSALVDVSAGLLFVLVAFLDARVLLQSAHLVYLCFPVLAIVAMAVGFWRGSRSTLPPWVTAVLTNIPLLVTALLFFSGRNKPFIVFPIVTFVFVCAGMALVRLRGTLWSSTAIVAIVCIAGALAGPRFVPLVVPSRNVKERPFPFTIDLADGTTIHSHDLGGKIVVLDFWATWCVPCQHELPALQRLYETTKGQKDLVFVAVDGVMTDSPGDSGDSLERATAYFRRGGYTIPLAWDGGAVLEKSFGLAGFPTLVVVDGHGQVRMRRVGYVGSEDLEKVLLEKIAELRSEGGRR
ncbi:MAG TPA: TlpA disulfide reductase family protein [Thermoanaerobaculia bacterium]